MVRIILVVCLVFVGISYVEAGNYNINFDILSDYTYDSNKIDITGGKVKFKPVGGPNWWDANYKYRQKLTITTSANLTPGVSVPISINTSSLESAGKLRSDKKDLRIVRHPDYSYSVLKIGTSGGPPRIYNNASLQFQPPFTLETFINLNGTLDTDGGLIDKTLGNIYFSFGVSSSRLYAYQSVDGSTWASQFGATTVISNPGWHHCAYVYDGTQIRLYLDGQLDGSANVSYGAGTAHTGTSNIRIGVGPDGALTSSYFDELRISNVVRYTGSSFTVPSVPFKRDSNTKVLLHFDAKDSLVDLDDSGNANNGMLDDVPQLGSIVGDFTGLTFSTAPGITTREIEREAGTTQTWVPVQANINSTTDSAYYVYYGYSNETQSPITYTHTTEASSTTVTNGDEQGQVYYTSTTTVISKVINLSSKDTKLSGFGESATKIGGAEIYYQLSLDGSNWLYWDGSKWTNASVTNYNTASVVNSKISKLSITGGKLYVKIFLINPNGTGQVDLDKVYLTGTIDAELEIFALDDPMTKLIVPAYSSDKLLQFSIISATIPTSGSEKKQALINYDFKATDVETGEEVKRFDKALTVVIHWKSTDGIYIDGITERIKISEANNRLKLAFWNGIYWVMLDTQVSVINNNKDILVSGKTSHLSQFAVVVKSALEEVKINVAPNPVTPRASQYNRVYFTFANTDSEEVELLIYDITGRLIRTIVDNSGTSSVSWDGRDENGEYVEGGVYIWQLKIGRKRAGKGTIVVAY